MEIKMIPREKIIPDPDQPRQHFDKEGIQQLANSINQFGLLQPLIVKSGKNGTYEIIAGERRWRASKFADMDELPCIIKDATKQEQEVQGLIENVHREDLSPIEKGRKAYSIFQLYGIDLSSKQLANLVRIIRTKRDREKKLNETEEKINDVVDIIGKYHDTISNWLNAISLSPKIQKLETTKIEHGEGTDGAILSRLSTIEDEELQAKTYSKIDEQEMGQREASRFISKIKDADEPTRDAFLTPGIKPIIDMDDRHKPMYVDIPEEDARSLREAVEAERKEREEKLRDPKVREQARLMNSWLAHSNIDIEHITCPVCGADHHNLKWTCHDMDIRETVKYLHDKIEEKKKMTA